MAIEIEHKFLLNDDSWRQQVSSSAYYCQGYMTSESNVSIRVRISGQQSWLNIKRAVMGSQRDEYEYAIPLADAQAIIKDLCRRPLIEKTRHFVPVGPHVWEIDEFEGDNTGLVVAEIELSEPGEEFQRPAWLGREVTDDIRYYNNNLTLLPYKDW